MLLDPDDSAFALITINEIVLSRAIGIVEARQQEMEHRLGQISKKQTKTAKAIGESIVTAAASYVAERFEDAGADLIEKVGMIISLDRINKQPGTIHSASRILNYSAMTTAFAAGLTAAWLCYLALPTVWI
jgi:hypothetical protein